MNNKTKYDLIIKVKDLINFKDIIKLDDFKDSEKLLYNAEKVLSIIYSNEELEKFFNEKVYKYEELKSNDKKYRQALKLRQKQLDEINKNLPFNIKLQSNTPYTLSGMLQGISNSYNEFTVEIYNEKEQRFYDYFIEAMGLYYHYLGIFHFVGWIMARNEEIYWNDDADCSYSETLARLFNPIFYTGYTQDIVNLYDYYYLKFQVDAQEQCRQNDINHTFYMFIAYRKILNDLLDYLYTIDLPKDKIQEYEKQSKINMYAEQLTGKESKLFKDLANNYEITVPYLAKKYSNSIRTIENQVDSIAYKLTRKKGIENLRTFIKKNILGSDR